jgi:hypothetical protein
MAFSRFNGRAELADTGQGSKRPVSYAAILRLLNNYLLEVRCLLWMHEPGAADVTCPRNIHAGHDDINGRFLRQVRIGGQADLAALDNPLEGYNFHVFPRFLQPTQFQLHAGGLAEIESVQNSHFDLSHLNRGEGANIIG